MSESPATPAELPAVESLGKTAHPSPHRARVGAAAMWFAILGAPAAWSVQQLVNAPLFAHGCYPHDMPLVQPAWPHLGGIALAVELAATVVCVLAGLVAARLWQRTSREKEGSGHHLIEAGDGRTRFMAMVAMICTGLFLLATIFAAAIPFMVPPCNG